MKTYSKKLTILSLSAALVASAQAVIEIEYTIDTIDSSGWFEENTPTYSQGDSFYLLSASTATPVSLDFSVLGEETLRINWSAPTGMMFEINMPNAPEFNDNGLSFFSLTSGVSGSGDPFFPTSSSVFSTVTGPAADLGAPVTKTLVIDSNSLTFGNQLLFTPAADGSTYQFTSVSIEATIPSSYDSSISFSSQGRFNASLYGEVNSFFDYTEPAPWFSIVPVPEPSMYTSIVGLLVLLSVGGSRRGRQ